MLYYKFPNAIKVAKAIPKNDKFGVAVFGNKSN